MDCGDRLHDFQGEDGSCHLEVMEGPTENAAMSVFMEGRGSFKGTEGTIACTMDGEKHDRES